jgi:hypothetical protein
MESRCFRPRCELWAPIIQRSSCGLQLWCAGVQLSCLLFYVTIADCAHVHTPTRSHVPGAGRSAFGGGPLACIGSCGALPTFLPHRLSEPLNPAWHAPAHACTRRNGTPVREHTRLPSPGFSSPAGCGPSARGFSCAFAPLSETVVIVLSWWSTLLLLAACMRACMCSLGLLVDRLVAVAPRRPWFRRGSTRSPREGACVWSRCGVVRRLRLVDHLLCACSRVARTCMHARTHTHGAWTHGAHFHPTGEPRQGGQALGGFLHGDRMATTTHGTMW